VRIDYSLCGVKMLDLDLCLSVSVNGRYILHTQTLRFIYNKILVWVSLYPSLSLSLVDCLSYLQHLLLLLHAIPSPPSFFLTLSHQPLLSRRQKTESATPLTIATTMPKTHHLLSSCWSCILSF
jgi:hypothetical protein